MSDESEPLPNTLQVKCPECGSVLTAPVSMAGKTLSCPGCLAEVVLPAGDVQVPLELSKPEPPEISTAPDDDPGDADSEDSYRIAGSSREAALPATPRPKKPPEEVVETIPLSSVQSRAANDLPTVGGTYGLGKVHDRPVMKIQVFEALARVKQEKTQPPPRSVFFSNVFDFPWRSGEAFSRWLWISLGVSAGTILIAVCIAVVEAVGNGGWLLAGFFLMAMVALVLWSLSYAVVCANAILQETAAGNSVIEGWPDGGVREWVFEFLPMIFIYLVSGTVTLVVAMPLQIWLGFLLPQVLLLQVFTFPVVWLCALDAGSIWIPFSWSVVRTIGAVPRTWWQFWGLSGAMLAAALGTLVGATRLNYWIAAVIAGPVLASVFFIYPRLLGRAVWQVSSVVNQAANDRAPKPRKKTVARKKPAGRR